MMQQAQNMLKQGEETVKDILSGHVRDNMRELFDAVELLWKQDEDMLSVMKRRSKREVEHFDTLKHSVLQKFQEIGTALSQFRSDPNKVADDFYINGSKNRAFLLFPNDSYSFKSNAITTADDVLTSFNSELYECRKKINKKGITTKSIDRYCIPVQYGRESYGRIANLEKANFELNRIKNEIYSVDLNVPPILDLFTPEEGSIIDEISRNIKNIIRNESSGLFTQINDFNDFENY